MESHGDSASDADDNAKHKRWREIALFRQDRVTQTHRDQVVCPGEYGGSALANFDGAPLTVGRARVDASHQGDGAKGGQSHKWMPNERGRHPSNDGGRHKHPQKASRSRGEMDDLLEDDLTQDITNKNS